LPSLLFHALLWALVWLILTPGEALAWGPATHVALGEAVLATAHLLPPAVRAILERNPISYLYGSVAADISFAKKYAEVGRHSHHWHIGEEILASADSEALQAVGLGYLSHLAADTIAHNVYVPRRLLLSHGSEGVGHTYWEHRMDVQLGEQFTAGARQVVLGHDHGEADQLFDDVLSRTLFSFRTNRRLFRGMVAFQDDARWHRVFHEILRRSRYDLPGGARARYLSFAYDYVMDYLSRGAESLPRALDPIGDENLRMAKLVRRELIGKGTRGAEELLGESADRFFPLPGTPLLYLPRAEGIQIPGLRSDELPAELRPPPPPAKPDPA
jgi:hypothetical protein